MLDKNHAMYKDLKKHFHKKGKTNWQRTAEQEWHSLPETLRLKYFIKRLEKMESLKQYKFASPIHMVAVLKMYRDLPLAEALLKLAKAKQAYNNILRKNLKLGWFSRIELGYDQIQETYTIHLHVLMEENEYSHISLATAALREGRNSKDREWACTKLQAREKQSDSDFVKETASYMCKFSIKGKNRGIVATFLPDQALIVGDHMLDIYDTFDTSKHFNNPIKPTKQIIRLRRKYAAYCHQKFEAAAKKPKMRFFDTDEDEEIPLRLPNTPKFNQAIEDYLNIDDG